MCLTGDVFVYKASIYDRRLVTVTSSLPTDSGIFRKPETDLFPCPEGGNALSKYTRTSSQRAEANLPALKDINTFKARAVILTIT